MRRDPAEALKRYLRTKTPTLTRPPRACCLALRASDTRINSANTLLTSAPDATLSADIGTDDLIGCRAPHLLTLRGGLIRELCKPVMIPWPGVPVWRAAELLGVSPRLVTLWMTRGHLVCRGYEPRRPHGHRGTPIPIVYTPGPIEPASSNGRPPHQTWGTLWQWRHERLPLEFEQTIRREPRYSMLRGKPVFRGWRWICPGRIGADGLPIACENSCNRLYAPLPIWSLPQAIGVRAGFELPSDCGLSGKWYPGWHEPSIGEGRRSFACGECWQPSGAEFLNHHGWNTFVTYLSGGLLYGYEVERPLDESPKNRIRRPFRQRKPRPAPRKQQIVDGLLHGLKYREIAARMGIKTHSVRKVVVGIYRAHGVHSRAELRATLTDSPRHHDAKRAEQTARSA